MNIKALQQALNELGFGPLAEDGDFGPKTADSLKRFQSANGLQVDGKIGPGVVSKITPFVEHKGGDKALLKQIVADSQDLAIRAMQIAVCQNGVRERTGNNDGPAVETFLRSVGLGKGYSWCMAFVYWCYDQAAEDLGVKNPLVKTGGCMKQWNETTLHKDTTPEPGAIFIMDLGGGAGHTGIVTHVNADGSFGTIEGNTNDNGSANGDGVYARTRKPGGKMKGFIKIS